MKRVAPRLDTPGPSAPASSDARLQLQYRICFVWKDGDAENVEIVDYH